MKYAEVNIGLCIRQKLNELNISKSEFARRLGIPNQNINRLLGKSSIDTEKLVLISKALDFNFFYYYNPIYDQLNNAENENNSIDTINRDALVYQNILNEEKVKHLEELLAEKERLINILLKDRK